MRREDKMFLQISIPRHKVQHHSAPGADCLSRQEATQDGGDDDEDGDRAMVMMMLMMILWKVADPDRRPPKMEVMTMKMVMILWKVADPDRRPPKCTIVFVTFAQCSCFDRF